MINSGCMCATCIEARAVRAAHTRVAVLEEANAALEAELARARESIAIEADAKRALAAELEETRARLRAVDPAVPKELRGLVCGLVEATVEDRLGACHRFATPRSIVTVTYR